MRPRTGCVIGTMCRSPICAGIASSRRRSDHRVPATEHRSGGDQGARRICVLDRRRRRTQDQRIKHSLSCASVARIEVRARTIGYLAHASRAPRSADDATALPNNRVHQPTLLIPWAKPPSKRFKEILLPARTERARGQTDQGRAARGAAQVHCTRACLAGRDRLGHSQRRRHRYTTSAAFVTST